MIGAGPAGLMAAEVLAGAGVQVDVFDTMPSVGRKFLLAGKGGLNLTHAEPEELLRTRYREAQPWLTPALTDFGSAALRAWALDLGITTFVGTSGRVFPQEMKAAPMLRAWLQRLRRQGVRFHMRHRWTGWGPQSELRFSAPEGLRAVRAQATVLALGGASWSRLGSDGAWVPWLRAQGVEVAVITALPLKALTRMRISSRYSIDATPPAELFDRADATQAIATAEAVITFLEQLDRPGA